MVTEEIQTKATPKKEVVTEKPIAVVPVAAPKPTPTNLPLRRGRRKQPSALSLKSLTHKVEAIEVVDEEEIDRNTLPKDSFTIDNLLAHWLDYSKLLIKQGDKSLASILTAAKPTLHNFEAVFVLPNNLMAEQLGRVKPHLLKHLRQNLNNFSIDLTIKVEETEVKKFVYTPQEKYEKLVELNPDIEILRSLFKLDI